MLRSASAPMSGVGQLQVFYILKSGLPRIRSIARLRVTTASHPQRLPQWSANISGAATTLEIPLALHLPPRRRPEHPLRNRIHQVEYSSYRRDKASGCRLRSCCITAVHLLVFQGTVLRGVSGKGITRSANNSCGCHTVDIPPYRFHSLNANDRPTPIERKRLPIGLDEND